MELRIELEGRFLGYVKHPSEIPSLAVEKGVGIEEAMNIRMTHVANPGPHILTKARNLLIEDKKKKDEFNAAVKEAAEKKEAPKKRGRKPKTEVTE